MAARILVVDDILANRRLMKAKLEAKYYTVILASGGPEALQIAAEHLPQVILLDVMMPGMDGYEVCRRLKRDDRTRHIPVVMLTALTDTDDRIRGLEAGADDFLSKPVDDFDLFARLEALARYNTVAHELRQREASNQQSATLTSSEQAELDRAATLLVIDSDERAANRMAQSLRVAGHTVATWQESQGQPAASAAGPDVILLAVSQQGHDALRLCAHLQTAEQTNDVPIIVTYDLEDREHAVQALGLGACDIVANPTDPQELLARVGTQLKRARYIEILRRRVDRGMELSVVDQLTGLYNRRYMLDHMHQSMQRAESSGSNVSVVAFDIDHFKQVNDEHGHEAGDLVLKDLAERIRMNVRPNDVVCRLGGEEFLVIMPETEGDLACIGAERIRQAIASSVFLLERSSIALNITVSAGVATCAEDCNTVADLLYHADQALYSAKQRGRNRTESRAA